MAGLFGGGDRVALDADGVLALFYHRMIDEWNQITSGKYTVEDLTEWPFDKTRLKLPKDKYFELYDGIWSDRWMHIPPSISEKLLLDFSRSFKVDIVSNRTEEQGRMLRLWLKKNYPATQLEIVTVPRIADKLDLEYDVYIDDAATLAESFIDNGHSRDKRLLLVSTPWNRNRGYETHEGITAVDDLGCAITLLLGGRVPKPKS